ncbi:MAG: TlpA family protein disulfide reductase [Thermomicrobiales bacterium]
MTDSGNPEASPKPRRWPPPLLAAILVAVALGVARPWQENDPDLGIVAQVAPDDVDGVETAPAAGSLAPNFRLETIDGEVVRLSDLRGTPIFLNFWATWCFSCVTEMPAMQRLADEYGDQLLIVGVNVGEEAGDARTFAGNFDIRYTLLLDAEMDVTRAYEVRAMPTSLFIDADGVVQSVHFGVLTPPQMKERIAPLLGA